MGKVIWVQIPAPTRKPDKTLHLCTPGTGAGERQIPSVCRLFQRENWPCLPWGHSVCPSLEGSVLTGAQSSLKKAVKMLVLEIRVCTFAWQALYQLNQIPSPWLPPLAWITCLSNMMNICSEFCGVLFRHWTSVVRPVMCCPDPAFFVISPSFLRDHKHKYKRAKCLSGTCHYVARRPFFSSPLSSVPGFIQWVIHQEYGVQVTMPQLNTVLPGSFCTKPPSTQILVLISRVVFPTTFLCVVCLLQSQNL